ncbi:MAG TPA: hypothetical protein VGM89_13195 [Puia sp.]|jgi:hypothetical protein
MLSDDTRKRLENIVAGNVLEGTKDNCTAVRNLLCSSFRTSTTVKKDFEGQSRVKEEQAKFLRHYSLLLFANTAYTFLGLTEKDPGQ